MKNLYLTPLLLLWLIAFTSCDNEGVDTQAPEITFLSIDPTPQPIKICGEYDSNSISIFGGKKVVFAIKIADDVELSQLKIDIHPNFDCHGHRSLSTTDWTVLELINLEGKLVEKELQLEVPETVTTGIYHFQLRAVDKAGNTSPAADFWNLNVQNPLDTVPPEYSIIYPTEHPTSIGRGDQLIYRLQISDNNPLNMGGNSRVELSYRRENSNNTFIAAEKRLSTENKETEVEIGFTIPSTLVTGDYIFQIRVWDGVNNMAEPISRNLIIN